MVAQVRGRSELDRINERSEAELDGFRVALEEIIILDLDNADNGFETGCSAAAIMLPP